MQETQAEADPSEPCEGGSEAQQRPRVAALLQMTRHEKKGRKEELYWAPRNAI